jgi:hypothetical protein
MLSALLREEIEITHLFRYPTISSLADYFSKKNNTLPINQKTIERLNRQKKSYRENRKLADKRKKG